MPFSIMSCFRGSPPTGPHISSPIPPKPPKALATLDTTTLDGKTPLIKRVSQIEYSLQTSSTGKTLSLVGTELIWLSQLNNVTGASKTTS